MMAKIGCSKITSVSVGIDHAPELHFIQYFSPNLININNHVAFYFDLICSLIEIFCSFNDQKKKMCINLQEKFISFENTMCAKEWF